MVELNSHALAEQLTLIEFETFQEITPTELSFQVNVRVFSPYFSNRILGLEQE